MVNGRLKFFFVGFDEIDGRLILIQQCVFV